jgi:hypothetical protein
MFMLYKAFHIILPVLFACFLVIPVAKGQDLSLFTVSDITVDVTSANAIKAREEAFNEALDKAFKELSSRMLSDEDAQNFTPPPPETISRLVKSFEITKEQLSSTRYAGTYTFHFDQNGMAQVFQAQEKAFIETASDPVLILPFLKRGLSTTLWNADNKWMHAWARDGNQGSLVPTITPLGDLNDVSDVDDTNIQSLSIRQLQPMLARYNASDVIMAEAVMDERLVETAQNREEPLGGLLSVSLYRLNEQGMPALFETFSVTPETDETLNTLFAKAVGRTQDLLKQGWKNKTLKAKEELSKTGILNVNVPISSLKDWTDIQAALKRSSAVTETKVLSLSPRAAQVQIEYYGQIERLIFDLQQVGLVLQKETPRGAWQEMDTPDTYTLMKQAMHDALPRRRYSQTF